MITKSNEIFEMMKVAGNKAVESIIELLQSHNLTEFEFGDFDVEDEADDWGGLGISVVVYEKLNGYTANLEKIELKIEDGKTIIYPYAERMELNFNEGAVMFGNVYFCEGKQIELMANDYASILSYLENRIERYCKRMDE